MNLDTWLGTAFAVSLVIAIPATAVSAFNSLRREFQRNRQLNLEISLRHDESQKKFFRLLQDQQSVLSSIMINQADESKSPTNNSNLNERHKPSVERIESLDLIKEIIHSLNTPITQLELAVDYVNSNPNLPDQYQQSLERAGTSVAIIKAFLEAFEISVESNNYLADTPASQFKSLLVATAASQGIPASNIDFELYDILHYKSPLILAILIPLFQNAIEASSPGSVEIHAAETDHFFVFDITNPFSGRLDPSLLDPGVTFKHSSDDRSSHSGLGLAVVGRLLRTVNGASIDFRSDGNSASFVIRLPKYQRLTSK